MEATDTKTNIIRQNIFPIFAFIIVVGLFLTYNFPFLKDTSPKKVSIEERIKEVTDLRETKKDRQAQISKLEEEIYILDQKIIAKKCSNYSEVGAKDTWDIECADFYNTQQSNIDESASNISENE